VSYLDVLGLDVADDLAPVARLAGHLSEHALVAVVAGVRVGDLDDLSLDALQLVVQQLQAAAVLLDVPLPHLLVDGPGDSLDQPRLEQLLKDLQHFLQDVLLLRILISVLLLSQVRLLFLVLFHQSITNYYYS
jgi:hypothetical protein